MPALFNVWQERGGGLHEEDDGGGTLLPVEI